MLHRAATLQSHDNITSQHMDETSSTLFKPLSADEAQGFQNTYGEVPLLRGEFDHDATTNYNLCKSSGIAAMTVWGCPLIPVIWCCCRQPIRAAAESRTVTLGEHSLFYSADSYCCCGPCMCKCSSVEQQVPLDKLQDLKLSQDFCGRMFDLWSVTMETAGQSGDQHAGPEVSLVGLKDHREFKQRVLQQRNLLAGRQNPPGMLDSSVPSYTSTAGKEDLSSLVPILLRIEEKLGNISCTPNRAEP